MERRMMEKMEQAVLTNEAMVRKTAKKYLAKGYDYWLDDVVQDVLLKAWTRIGQFDEKAGSLSSWMYTMTRNHCFDLMERKGNSLAIRVGTDDLKNLSNASSFSDEYGVDSKTLRKALERAGERDRIVLTLKYYFGYSGKEIAVLMDIPEKNIGMTVMRAKDRVKRILVGWGYGFNF
jgi:RNA polymerase sigma-70 factor (ECF subfamily)